MPLILVYRETFVLFAYVVNLWSCWNSGYELDIVATTRSNRVCQSFSFSLSLSTELLEDKQGFKLGGVDTSPTYLLFQTLLPLFWTVICIIWMELTWTDVVFSRLALVLFLCRNQSSPNVLKIYGEQFWKISKISAPSSTSGGGPVGHKPLLRHHPLVAVGRLVGPTGTCRPQLQLYKLSFVPEKIKWEVFVAFSIRRRCHHLFFIWRADPGSVLGSVEGKSSPSSSSTFFPLQFHEALRRSWVIYS